MGIKNVQVDVDRVKKPILSDKLGSDCLSVEAVDKIVLNPGTVTQINLLIKNSSTVGRMGHLYSNYDASRGIRVQITQPEIYVAPEGATMTSALVEVYATALEGDCRITFGVG